MKRLKLGIVALTLVIGVQIAAAQSSFSPGDKVIFVAGSSPIYTSATATATNVSEISRGTPSRIGAIDETAHRIYLITNANGWVDETIDGQQSLVPYDESTLAQIEDEALADIADDLSDTTAYVTAATVANNSGRDEEALDLLNRALEQAPNDGYLLYQRGGVLLDLHHWTDANLDLDNAKNTYSIANVYNRIGVAYEGLRQFQDAASMMSLAADMAPQWGLIRSNLANQYNSMGDPNGAIGYYSAAIELDPLLAVAYRGRGTVYMNMGDTDRALDEFNRAIEIAPYEPFGYIKRAVLYAQFLGDYERAMADYDTAIAVDPEFATTYSDRAVTYIKYGEIDLAIADLKHGLELDPTNVFTHYNLATIYSQSGYFEEGLEEYNLTMEVGNRFDYSALLYRAQLLIALDRYDEALADLDSYIQGEPSEYFEVTARILRATVYTHRGEYMLAQSDLGIAQRTSPDFTTNFTYYGSGYRVTDTRAQELIELQNAAAANPDDAKAQLRVGELAIQLGMWQIAFDSYIRYDELTTDEDMDFPVFLNVLKDLAG